MTVQRAECRVPRSVPRASCLVLCAVLSASWLVRGGTTTHAQMPDPRVMHGQAIPAGELPAGSVTVRVVREALGNNISGVQVELHGAGPVRTAQTGEDGRAQFTGVTAGARVHAIATVGGERLESTQFDVPAAGGVRTILVAGLGLGTGGSAAAAPAPPPTSPPAGGPALTFGSNTRFAVEFQDDTIAVFYLLEIVNGTGAPVALPSPLRIDLPDDAVGASVLEGASPLASANGPHVVITGPIPAGVTPVPVAYRIESWGAVKEIAQTFPLPIDQVAFGVQRLGGLTVQSPQASAVREASLSGQAFFIANGGRLAAGTSLRVTLGGLPHKSPWPLSLALGLSVVVAGGGIWLALTPALRDAGSRSQLEARRLRGLAALKVLDDEYRAGALGEAAYQERRQRQVATLERIYADLDAAGGPAGGGEGRVA